MRLRWVGRPDFDSDVKDSPEKFDGDGGSSYMYLLSSKAVSLLGRNGDRFMPLVESSGTVTGWLRRSSGRGLLWTLEISIGYISNRTSMLYFIVHTSFPWLAG